jgi:acetyltransferase
MFERYGLIEGNDFEEMLDLAPGFLALRRPMPAGNASASAPPRAAAGVWMARCLRAAGLDVPVLDDATRASIDVHLPSYATSQNPVDSTAQGVQKLGYAQFARLVAHSPSVDGVIVVITAAPLGVSGSGLPKLKELAASRASRCSCGPIRCPSPRTSKSSTRRAIRCSPGARLRAHAAGDGRYQVLRERLLRPIEIVPCA